MQAQRIWVDSTRLIWNKTQGQDSEKIMLAKYETVAADPYKYFAKVHEFLGLEPREVPDTDYFRPIRSDVWREEVPMIMEAATPDFKKYLELFGYEV
jgi:hypothetical protein